MSEEIAVRLDGARGSLIPTPKTLTEAMDLAVMLSKSTIVPKEMFQKPADVLLAMEFGAELGFGWVQALSSVYIVNGKPSLYGDSLKSLVIGLPDCEDFDEDNMETVLQKGRGRCKIKRTGKRDVEETFSIQDAQKAGYWAKSGPWSQVPGRMLQLWARAFAIRNAYPDKLKGIRTAEEMLDVLPPEPTAPAEAPRRSRRTRGEDGKLPPRVIDASSSTSTGETGSGSPATGSEPGPSGTSSAKSESSANSQTSSSAGSPESSSSTKQSPATAAAPAPSTPASPHADDVAVFAKVTSRNEKTSKAGSVYVVLTLQDEEGKESMCTSYEPDVVTKSKPLHLSGDLGKFWTYKQDSWLKVRAIEDAAAEPADKEPPQ